MSPVAFSVSALVLGVAVYGVVRGADVRLVLLVAGLVLGGLALRPLVVLDAFARTIGDGKIVGPICSAMGFSFVLREIGSDRELVRLLVRPFRHLRWLLVPGGAVVGFVTNMAITSQTAAAAAVGPILVPIMLAAGFHPILVGGTLVLGCSGGGNLHNPGEPDIVTIQSATGALLMDVLDRMFVPGLVGFAVAVATFAITCRLTPTESAVPPQVPADEEDRPVDVPMALLPLLPIGLLFLLQPRLRFVPALLRLYPDGLPVVHAMLFSMLVAMTLRPRAASAQCRAFFEGMGFAFVRVISLIVAASSLIAGMEAVGLVKLLAGLVSGEGTLSRVVSGAIPWTLAVLSGSGTAPSVAFSKAVLPTLSASHLTGAIDLGIVGAIGATFGRTMSPVAAVVVFSSTLVGCTPMHLVRRMVGPLVAGFAAVLVVIAARSAN
ncbi:MAG TPA: C4-dicarboxylate transporter DcuC [Polyangiaceae bacterium]